MLVLNKKMLSFYTYLTKTKTYFEQIQIMATVKWAHIYFHE